MRGSDDPARKHAIGGRAHPGVLYGCPVVTGTRAVGKDLGPVSAVTRVRRSVGIHEIAGLKIPAVPRVWARAPARSLPPNLPGALIVRKPEQPVFEERPSNGVPELVAFSTPFRDRKRVASSLSLRRNSKGGTVKAVGAGLGDGVHDGAAEIAVLGVEGIGDQPELRNRVEVGDNSRAKIRPSLTSPPLTRNALAVSRWPFTETLPEERPPETGRSCWIDPRKRALRRLAIQVGRYSCGRSREATSISRPRPGRVAYWSSPPGERWR